MPNDANGLKVGAHWFPNHSKPFKGGNVGFLHVNVYFLMFVYVIFVWIFCRTSLYVLYFIIFHMYLGDSNYRGQTCDRRLLPMPHRQWMSIWVMPALWQTGPHLAELRQLPKLSVVYLCLYRMYLKFVWGINNAYEATLGVPEYCCRNCILSNNDYHIWSTLLLTTAPMFKFSNEIVHVLR